MNTNHLIFNYRDNTPPTPEYIENFRQVALKWVDSISMEMYTKKEFSIIMGTKELKSHE